jgi:hypothetical protein
MAVQTEYAKWQDELAGKRPNRLGHVMAIAAGVALAVLAIMLERGFR